MSKDASGVAEGGSYQVPLDAASAPSCHSRLRSHWKVVSDVLDEDDNAHLAFGCMAIQASTDGLVPPVFPVFWGTVDRRGNMVK